jgi:murein DD-endopeptidase MepM/ murein hydrolase activator NlpD
MFNRLTRNSETRSSGDVLGLPIRLARNCAALIEALPDRLFPERQIFLRSRGQVSHVVLSKRVQMGVMLAGIALASWTGFATYRMLDLRVELTQREAALDQSRSTYQLLREQVVAYQASVGEATRELGEQQASLRKLFEQNQALRADLKITERQLLMTESEKTRMSDARLAMRRQLEQMEATLQDMRGEKDSRDGTLQALRARLAGLEAERNEMTTERTQLDRRLWALENELSGALERGNLLDANLVALRNEIKKVSTDKVRTAEDNQKLITRVRELEQQLAAMEMAHREILKKLAERTRQDVQEVERTIARTGLPVDKLLREDPEKSFGKGGPFVALRPPPPAEGGLEPLLAALDLHMGRMGDLQSLLRALPLSPPVETYTFMSGFGPRSDPFTGRPAMHNGVDLGSKYGSPIRATAPGIVTYAGWRSNYGRIVEIDHGRGIITRYGHMNRVDVKKGQKVGLRTVLGTVGTSGRSTGAHVHYEVLVKGTPQDPMKFLKAGKHVFKG